MYTICTIEFGAASLVNSFCSRFILFLDLVAYMARKGPEVGKGMLDFVEDLSYDVVSH